MSLLAKVAVFFRNFKGEIDYPPVNQDLDGKQQFLMADTALIQLQMLVFCIVIIVFGCIYYLGRGHLNQPR